MTIKTSNSKPAIILETKRLLLRNFTMDDFDDFWEYMRMPEIGPRVGWPVYTESEMARERLTADTQKPHLFAIVFKEDNKVIGSIELMDPLPRRYPGYTFEPGAREIGFAISCDYWGRGIMTEAASEVQRFAFEELEVPVIYIGHIAANLASGRVQDKLGFPVIDRLKNTHTWVDGAPSDYIIRKMTAANYYDLSAEQGTKS